MQIAIVGAGVSGLVAARHLSPMHEVTVFECSARAGGHVHTVDLELDGRHFSIDTGFIVFNERTYPNFTALLADLGVASKPTAMSFSVRDDSSGLEYNGHSLNTLFSQRSNLIRPGFWRMLLEIVRFSRQASALATSPYREQTVEEFLLCNGYSRRFAENYLLPMGAAIWSCPTGTFHRFPVHFVASFFRNHGLLDFRNRPTWRVIEGGSRTYVEAIARELSGRIRLNTPIARVRRTGDRVFVTTGRGEESGFDHLVFACHSDQALAILGPEATSLERRALGAFPYSRNTAVLHTDETVLPRSRRAWAAWNHFLNRDRSAPASITYNMNILQGIRSQHTFCVTLNDDTRIRPERVLRRFVYHHPVFTLERERAQSLHPQLLNHHRTSYCGAYWGNGFHEDGVNSGLAVARAIQSQPRPGLLAATAAGVSAT